MKHRTWLGVGMVLLVGGIAWVACDAEAPTGPAPVSPAAVRSDGSAVDGHGEADRDAMIRAELSRLRNRLEARGVPEDMIAAGLVRAEKVFRGGYTDLPSADDLKAAVSASFQRAAKKAAEAGVSEADIAAGWQRVLSHAEEVERKALSR